MGKGFLYVRLSEKDAIQMDTSIENQIKDGTKWFETHNHKLLKIFNEGFVSGADRERPEFTKMIMAAKDHLCDFILVKDDTRFCRDAAFLTNTIKDLKAHGVKVMTFYGEDLSENITMTTVRGAIAEELILKGRIEQKRLVERKEKEREVFGQPCFGYKINRQIIDEKFVNLGWVEVPEEIEVIRDIFESYVNGEKVHSILHRIPFIKSVVGVYQILRNKKYIGIFEYRMREKDSNGKVISTQIRSFRHKYPPIIDEELFNKAQVRLNGNCRWKEL